MSELSKEIAEMRKPKPMIVKLEPEEARLALSKGSMVWAKVSRKRVRCWLTKAKEMYIGNIPARLAGTADYETEIYFHGGIKWQGNLKNTGGIRATISLPSITCSILAARSPRRPES